MSPWSRDCLKTLESSLDVDSLHISSSLTSFETARQVLLATEIERIQHVQILKLKGMGSPGFFRSSSLPLVDITCL